MNLLLSNVPAVCIACCLSPFAAGDLATLNEGMRIHPPDGRAGEQFGSSCVATEDTIVISSYRDADLGISAGGVYVYERQANGRWSSPTNLHASDGAADDIFGLFMDIQDEMMVVSATGDDDLGANSGSIFVFSRGDGGTWSESAKILAPDGTTGDCFGSGISIDGRRMLVGAFLDDEADTDVGSVYVLDSDPAGQWHHTGKLTASDGTTGDHFGLFLALSGRTAVVGAPYSGRAGAAYIFERRFDGTWVESMKITAGDAADGAEFGGAVAFSGDTLMIGAPGDNAMGEQSGSMYVYKRAGNSWIMTDKLTASDGHAWAAFGRSAVLEGNRMIVGSPGDGHNGPDSGSAYFFEEAEGGAWTEVTKFIPNMGDPGDYFGGYSPAIAGETAVIGSRFNDMNGEDSGAAYVFDINYSTNPADISSPQGGEGVPDGIVDGDDLLVLFSYWGGCPDDCTPGTCNGDLNGDCIVDGADLEMMLGQWSAEE